MQNETGFPTLSEYEVFQKIRKSRKPNSSVGCDVPLKIVKTFSVELASPITKIFNIITKSQKYPDHWKVENGIAIPKIWPPENEDSLRIISKTPYFSKIYESFVFDWLMEVIRPFLDPDQCGVKGMSITHYLVKFLHFIHSSLDFKEPNAVIGAFIDMSKAFNRVDHSILIEDLYKMKCPSWLLRIVFSFLDKRSLILSFKGFQTLPKVLNGVLHKEHCWGLYFSL